MMIPAIIRTPALIPSKTDLLQNVEGIAATLLRMQSLLLSYHFQPDFSSVRVFEN